MFRLVTVVGVLGGVSAAIAEPVRMTSDDIRRAMPGALLEIDTPLRISIPVKVGTDGLMSAEAGALGLTLGATKDRGRWWTADDKLCMKWFRWFDARERCMVLHREGNRVQWAEGSGESGTATITEAPKTVVASAPAKPKKEQKVVAAPPVQRIDDVAAAPAPVVDEPAVEKPERKPFATAALTSMLQAEKESEPARLGMNEIESTPDIAPAVVPRDEVPVQRAESPPAAKKPHQAKAPAATPPARKVARKEPPAAKAAVPTFRVSGVGYGDTLNVRKGPSEYHDAVGTIPSEGRGVKIIGACRDLWCPVRHGRTTGWVNRFYLAEESVQQTSARR
jgi:uncharacterized protein YraI